MICVQVGNDTPAEAGVKQKTGRGRAKSKGSAAKAEKGAAPAPAKRDGDAPMTFTNVQGQQVFIVDGEEYIMPDAGAAPSPDVNSPPPPPPPPKPPLPPPKPPHQQLHQQQPQQPQRQPQQETNQVSGGVLKDADRGAGSGTTTCKSTAASKVASKAAVTWPTRQELEEWTVANKNLSILWLARKEIVYFVVLGLSSIRIMLSLTLAACAKREAQSIMMATDLLVVLHIVLAAIALYATWSRILQWIAADVAAMVRLLILRAIDARVK
jgi:hypothetical protein